MKAIKIDVRTLTIGQKKMLAQVLQDQGAFRIERVSKLAVQGESHKVWEAQNGLFVYVSEFNELKQGYSQKVFNESPLQAVTLCDIIKSL